MLRGIIISAFLSCAFLVADAQYVVERIYTGGDCDTVHVYNTKQVELYNKTRYPHRPPTTHAIADGTCQIDTLTESLMKGSWKNSCVVGDNITQWTRYTYADRVCEEPEGGEGLNSEKKDLGECVKLDQDWDGYNEFLQDYDKENPDSSTLHYMYTCEDTPPPSAGATGTASARLGFPLFASIMAFTLLAMGTA